VDRNVPEDLKMDFSRFIQKPFLIATGSFTTAHPKFEMILRYPFPEIIMDNATAAVPFLHSCLYRLKACVALQLSGTPSHQGCLLVAAVPPGSPEPTHPNQILSAPHVFLNANEATSVCLEAPMYTPSQLLRTNDYNTSGTDKNSTFNSTYSGAFDIMVFVMNPLAAASGASTTVSLSMHAIFEEADFYVPKNGVQSWTQQSFIDDIKEVPTMILDRAASGLKSVVGDAVDMARGAVKRWTGFHNPNHSEVDHRVMVATHNFSNNVDIKQFYEVMDPHSKFSRICDDYYFRTEQDEMDLRYLLSKPVYIGTAALSSTSGTGTRLMSYPITPMVEASAPGGVLSLDWYSVMRTIYECSRLWRGGLKLHIQAVCTNFHYCKLVFYKDYSGATGLAYDKIAQYYPKYEDVHNLTLDTIEFSAGGQVQTVELPYCAMTNQLECTKDYVTNVAQHGMVHCYVVQPLVFNNNVPTSIEFNFYISGGDDLEFAGYDTDNYLAPPQPFPVYTPQSGTIADIAEFYKPQSGIPSFVDVSPQTEILVDSADYKEVTKMSLRPNTSIRDYLRRMHPTPTYSYTIQEGQKLLLYTVDLASLINNNNNYSDAMTMMCSHYLGLSGGLKVKIRIQGGLHSSLYFIPPSTYTTDGESPFYVKTFPTTPSSLPVTSQGSDVAVGQFFADSGIKIYPIPVSELPSYTYNSDLITHIAQHEVAIPNMSPFNFVGSAYKWTEDSESAADSLGFIVVAINLPDTGIIDIVTSIAFNDETRLGFQVFNLKKSIMSYKVLIPGSLNYQITRDSVQSVLAVESETQGGLRLSNLPLCGAYFAT
jgi:hypothetical protein